MGSSNVSVINLANNTVVTLIPVGGNPRGVVVNPTTNRAYVANSNDNTVSVINTTTNKTIATINVGQYPFGIDLVNFAQ